MPFMASYTVNRRGVAQARKLIKAKRYVLNSNWGDVQPKAASENAFLKEHSWKDYSGWFLGLTEGVADETKARYAFVYGDLRRLHRSGLSYSCNQRAVPRTRRPRAVPRRPGEVSLGSLPLLPVLRP